MIDLEPIADSELAALFQPVAEARAIAVAVSGGADSTALMLLAARWASHHPARPMLHVLSVDHGLRAEAAGELRQVEAQARRLGLSHHTLVWAGEKPVSDIQAAARAARYELLAARARALGAEAVLLAHHLEDQAETFLLRLARGSGVSGLAAMARERQVDGMRFVRPFLELRKGRLIATLRAAGIAWIEDPTNEDVAFARARMRKLAPALAAEGLTPERLAQTVAAMRRAGEALDRQVDAAFRAHGLRHPGGFAALRPRVLHESPREIGLRLLAMVLGEVGGGPYPPRLERLEALHHALVCQPEDDSAGKRTLSGVVVETGKDRIWFYRELGRADDLELTVAPGGRCRWDGRFDIAAPDGAGGPILVRPLGAAGRAALPVPYRGDWPVAAAETVPSAWIGDDLAAVPAFGYVDVALMPRPFAAIWRTRASAMHPHASAKAGKGAVNNR